MPVIFNDDGHDQGAITVGTGLHGLNDAGNRGVDRDAQPLAITDFLTQIHMVTLFDQRLTGRADVLNHGDDHRTGAEGLDHLVSGQLFSVLRVDTAKEGKCHFRSPLYKNRGRIGKPTRGYRRRLVGCRILSTNNIHFFYPIVHIFLWFWLKSTSLSIEA